LAEQFTESLDVAHLACGSLATRRALLQAILFELKMPYQDMDEGELRLSLIDRLAPRGSTASDILLIVDEAHALAPHLLEEIRMITNVVRGGSPRVHVILAGTLGLEERFTSPRLASFNQRVAARCYLTAFGREETFEYIRFQLDASDGHLPAVFTEDALAAVFRATDGIPRLVNQLCDHALVLAGSDHDRPVTSTGIDEAWADLQQLPAPWVSAANSAPNGNSSSIEFGSLDDETAESPGLAPQPAFPDEPDPFAESFDDEEMVIDPYAAAEENFLAAHRRVLVRGGSFAAQLIPPLAPSPPRPPLSVAHPQEPVEPCGDEAPADAGVSSTSDSELIIVDDDAEPGEIPASVGAREKAYSQLFSRLRFG
jgi:hypothetical protein